MAESKITKDDLKAKFEELEGGLNKAKDSAAPAIPMLAVALSVGVFVVALFLGYRLGKKRSAVVEIKRL